MSSAPGRMDGLHITGVLALAFFLIIGAHYVFKASCGSMLVERYGPSGVPMADLLEAVLAIGVVIPVLSSSRLRVRLSAILGVAAALAVFILSLAPMVPRQAQAYDFALFATFLAGGLLISLSNYSVWMLLTATVEQRTGLHVTVFGAGAQVAMILASFGVEKLLDYTTPAKLLWLVAVGYAAAWAILLAGVRRFRCVAGRSTEFAALALRNRDAIGLTGVLTVLRSPYLRLLCLVIIAHITFGQAMRWRVYEQASASDTVSGAAAMLTVFYRYSGFAALGAQLILLPLAFRFVKVQRGLFIQPAIGILSLALLLQSTSPEAIFASIAVFTSVDYTINKAMSEVLYIPLPIHVKVQVKSVIAMLVPKLGAMIASALILSFGADRLDLWAGTLCAVAVVWTAAAALALQYYRKIQSNVTLERYESIDAVAVDAPR